MIHTNFPAVPRDSPEVLEWVKEQTRLGFTQSALFKSLVESGYVAETAARLVNITPLEFAFLRGQRVVPDGYKIPRAIPFARINPSTLIVDGGDKMVKVLMYRGEPDVVVFAGLLNDEECDALMQKAQPRLSRSLTVDVATGGEQLHPDRTSQGMFITRGEDELIQRIEKRISILLNWPVSKGEGLQVLRYPPGAQYKPHYDYFDPREPGSATILKRGGQRVSTLIMYLFEPEAGGATVFPDIDLKVLPIRGNAVFFSYPYAHPDSHTLHGGDPVQAGEKWIATKWLREDEFV